MTPDEAEAAVIAYALTPSLARNDANDAPKVPVTIGDACLYTGDALTLLRSLPDSSCGMCVTSPPYFNLRDYGHEGQIGNESTVAEYVANLVAVFTEVKRVLRDDATLWLNLGDSYAGGGRGPAGRDMACLSDKQMPHGRDCGYAPKNLYGVPWRVAFALQDSGWILRSEIIWHSPNKMPSSVTDRPTVAHETIFLLSKQARYYYDQMAVAEKAQYAEQHANKSTSWGTDRKHPNKNNVDKYAFTGDNHTCLEGGMRNMRSVWTIPTQPFAGEHYAAFPVAIPKRCILAGSRIGDTVLDPFSGAATSGVAAVMLGRKYIGIDLSETYNIMAAQRLANYAHQELLDFEDAPCP